MHTIELTTEELLFINSSMRKLNLIDQDDHDFRTSIIAKCVLAQRQQKVVKPYYRDGQLSWDEVDY